jgi:hypothetical protein
MQGSYEVFYRHHPQCLHHTWPFECECKPATEKLSADAHRAIRDHLLQECAEYFYLRGADYANVPLLGSAGPFADLNRKMGKLRQALWEKKPLETGEDVDEILRDVFGHTLLTLYCWRVEQGRET